MFATSAAVLTLAAAVAYAQDLSIQAPSLAQCANSVINYYGGTGPYYVAILQGQDPCNHDAIQEFYNVNGNSVSYTPVLSSGAQVMVYVEDSNGQEAWSDVITLGYGDSSCLGNAPPNVDTSYTGDSHTYTPSTYTPPTSDSSTDNTTDNSTTDKSATDNSTTDNSTTDNNADSSYQSPSDGSSSSSSSATPDSGATPADSATSSTSVAPYNPAPSPNTDNSSVSVQSTNNSNSNSNSNSNQDTTPANANSKAGGATGLAVSAFTALSAVLVVSFGLF